MHILFLTQWYPPEPDVRIGVLARSLVERGHQVTVLTGYPNYPYGRIYDGYKQKLWQREEKDGVRVVRFPLYPDHSESTLRRMFTYLSFALSVSLLGPFFAGKPDVIWVYNPPLTIAIPAMWISLLRRAPFVYEIQDMWPETVAASGMMDADIVIRCLGALAHVTYRRAAAISVISNGFKMNLIAKGVPENKITVIPNWSDDTIYSPTEYDLAFGEQYHLAGHFNVIFAGTMGPSQHLQTVIEAAELVRDIPDIQFVFIGDGLDLPILKAMVTSKNLLNVLFIERQPAIQMPKFFAWGGAMLVQLRDDPLFHITIPSKTLSYLACACFIICAVPGDGSEVVERASAGLICPPSNTQALANTVRRAYAMPEAERRSMGQAGRDFYLKWFSRPILVDEYEALFRRVAQH